MKSDRVDGRQRDKRVLEISECTLDHLPYLVPNVLLHSCVNDICMNPGVYLIHAC